MHFGITLGRLWVYEHDFGVTLVRFRKTLIFPTDFNDFMQLWDQLGVILGSLWAHFKYMSVALG